MASALGILEALLEQGDAIRNRRTSVLQREMAFEEAHLQARHDLEAMKAGLDPATPPASVWLP